jgi:hypothetical protein
MIERCFSVRAPNILGDRTIRFCYQSTFQLGMDGARDLPRFDHGGKKEGLVVDETSAIREPFDTRGAQAKREPSYVSGSHVA